MRRACLHEPAMVGGGDGGGGGGGQTCGGAENSLPTVRRDGCLATIGNNMYYAGGYNGPPTSVPKTMFPNTTPNANDQIFEKFYGCARVASTSRPCRDT